MLGLNYWRDDDWQVKSVCNFLFCLLLDVMFFFSLLLFVVLHNSILLLLNRDLDLILITSILTIICFLQGFRKAVRLVSDALHVIKINVFTFVVFVCATTNLV